MNEEEDKKKISQYTETDDKDTRRMITRTAGCSMNEESALTKKIKTYNEEALVPKLGKENNLRIFCSKRPFEGVKEIIENTVSKSYKVEHLIKNGNEEGRIYNESMRVKKMSQENISKCIKLIFTVLKVAYS